MKKIPLMLIIMVLITCYSNRISAQVVQKQANKYQLINGVKLKSKHSKLNLIKLNANSITKVNNLQNSQVQTKNKKTPKISKYRKTRPLINIKKEDD